MIYVLKTKKPIKELLCNLPLRNLVELQRNVDVIRELKDEKGGKGKCIKDMVIWVILQRR